MMIFNPIRKTTRAGAALAVLCAVALGSPAASAQAPAQRRITQGPAYTRYTALFAGSRWIWSLNLVFDNVVIARKTVR